MADKEESSNALAVEKPEREETEGGDENEDDREEHKRDSEVPPSESQQGVSPSSKPSGEAEPKNSNSETLAAPPSAVSALNHQCADLLVSSSTQTEGKAESKETTRPSDKENITKEAVQTAHTLTENQPQVSACPTSLSELSPTSVTKSLSSALSPTIPDQRLSPQKVNNVDMLEVDKKNPSGGKTLSAVSIARTSASDGYNWRKYGQKQVKSPTGSRSYYRCTHSDCCAKKIECCDHSGHVVEIVYKSQHSHDPPRKTNSARQSKIATANEPAVENRVLEHPIAVLNGSNPTPPSKEPPQEAPFSAEKKRENSSDLGENGKISLKEEHVNEPEQKKRMKRGDISCPDSPVKPGKKPKFVVHAAGDVGISGDGYRWRKYGQKMVKGNPHPRNYYRCTSAGCPVRKHIETAVDNTNAVIITYKGVHDHDMPVPKKRHGPPSAPLVAAAAPASMSNMQLKKTESLQNQKSPTQWSVDTEGELTGEALDLGGEKAMESARTLLSIGFEIKPC
ncbi:hypothetical protein L6164_014188 [Bauhinia variegata]|uniref:Uncharacterized protein n=1 Tax=Bauhinia variegata TaxID=167791 RepID=A0ACB9NK60_BAUVA|nr:hypothetical protein L6164_014188 [Bauhinia variegata]